MGQTDLKATERSVESGSLKSESDSESKDESSSNEESSSADEESENEESENDETVDKSPLEILRDTLRDLPLAKLAQLKKDGFRGKPLHVALELPGPEYINKWLDGSLALESLTRKRRGPSQPREGKKSKHAPLEVTSKRRVSRFKLVVEKPGYKSRDPRFQAVSGKVDPKIFDSRYAFLDEQRAEEIAQLKTALKKDKKLGKKEVTARGRSKHRVMKEDERESIMASLTKLEQEKYNIEASRKSREFKETINRRERDLVGKGKQPYYLKKSEMKKLKLEEKYKELKQSGGLDKFVSKKRKKNASKERRFMD